MRFFKYFTLLIFLSGCKPQNPYSQLVERVNTKLTPSKYVLFLFYKPLECLNCNAIVSSMVHDTSLANLWGDNKFIVYPGIRDAEVLDYKKNLETQGGIYMRSINDNRIYRDILELANIDADKGFKPLFLIFSPVTGKVYKFDLKDTEAPEKLRKIRDYDK